MPFYTALNVFTTCLTLRQLCKLEQVEFAIPIYFIVKQGEVQLGCLTGHIAG